MFNFVSFLAAVAIAASPATHIRNIENAFTAVPVAPDTPVVRFDIPMLMRISNVTQMSIAVIDNDRIDWAKAYGTQDDGSPVTTQTLFPACSISKPITALAALRLVEGGKLSLDENVNDKLTSWKVPDNQFTREAKVTLRRILTHTAGTLVHGFPGTIAGSPVPTLIQVLNGEKPATNDPVRVTYIPGTKQSYSGGGFLILQQLMIDVTGEPFPRIVRESVFDPLGLKSTTFDPGARAAAGRDRDGERLPARVVPELAAGGVWTTPSDLARILIEVARSRHGRSNRILSTAMTREMLRVQVNPHIETIGGRAGHADRPRMVRRTTTGLRAVRAHRREHRFRGEGHDVGFRPWNRHHGEQLVV